MAQRPNRPQRKEKSEYDQKMIDLRRVARVVAGGRRFAFRATLIIGNRRGDVGVGTAKGVDTATAIDKAFRRAKKNLISVPLTKDHTIPHEVVVKYGSSRVMLKPARIGKGLMAGGPIRIVCDLAGVQNVTGKIISRSSNKLNNALAALEALRSLRKGRIHKTVRQDKPAEEPAAANA